MTDPSGNSEFCFPSTSMFPSASPLGTLKVSEKQNPLFPFGPVIKCLFLYNWRFFRHSAPIHWLVHRRMTSNIETVSRQMPWFGKIAKTMTSNRKQFTVTREMLTAVARHLSTTWLFVFHRFDPFALLYSTSLNDWSLGEQWILFPSNLDVSLDFVSGNIEILGKQNLPFPRDQSLSVYCLTWFRGCQNKLNSIFVGLFYVSKSLLGVVKQEKLKNLQFWPERLGSILELRYIERGLLVRVIGSSGVQFRE